MQAGLQRSLIAIGNHLQDVARPLQVAPNEPGTDPPLRECSATLDEILALPSPSAGKYEAVRRPAILLIVIEYDFVRSNRRHRQGCQIARPCQRSFTHVICVVGSSNPPREGFRWLMCLT